MLDPIVTNANVTRAFGYMVFDTLIAMDEAGEYRPQMLQSWQASEDRLTWTFTLRPGLEWHDGTPVTAEDCVASLNRWGRRDGMGTRLMAATRALRAVDQRSFVLELSRPFGFVKAAQLEERLGQVLVERHVAWRDAERFAERGDGVVGGDHGGDSDSSSRPSASLPRRCRS